MSINDLPYRIVTLLKNESENERVHRLFQRREFEVTHFNVVQDLLDYLKSSPAPRCFVTDMELEECTGLEVIAKIRTVERWKETPVIVLAASVSKSNIINLTKLKIKGYLIKPYDPPRLFRDVLKAMGLEVVTETKTVKRKKRPDDESTGEKENENQSTG